MCSGSADYNDRTGAFCIDDAFQGAALYKSDSETRVHTFAVKLTQPNVLPRKVCFADNFGSVVSGSDHGLVYVFDRRTEEVTDTLFVDPADWVQTVTVSLSATPSMQTKLTRFGRQPRWTGFLRSLPAALGTGAGTIRFWCGKRKGGRRESGTDAHCGGRDLSGSIGGIIHVDPK